MSHEKGRNEARPHNTTLCDERETFPYWGNFKKPGISKQTTNRERHVKVTETDLDLHVGDNK